MTFGLESNYEAATAANIGNHDPRSLYVVALGSSRAHYLTPRKEARDDVIAADVSRHVRPPRGSE